MGGEREYNGFWRFLRQAAGGADLAALENASSDTIYIPAEDEKGDRPTFRVAAGIFYFWWWVKRANLRYYLDRGAVGVLLVSLGLLGAEILLEIAGARASRSRSITVNSIVFVAFAVTGYAKLREWTERAQEFYFVATAEAIVKIFAQGQEAERSNEDTVVLLLGLFSQSFRRHLTAWGAILDRLGFEGAAGAFAPVRATLSVPIENGTLLQATHYYPAAGRFDRGLRLKMGQGGCGHCFATRLSVYIPRRSLRHALELVPDGASWSFSLKQKLYKADRVEAFESLLCVPVVAHGKCLGVLSFDSKKKNAFRRLDMAQAVFYGFVMAQILLLADQGMPAICDGNHVAF